MGKVILTEGQYQRLKKRLINNIINEQDYGSVGSTAMAGAATGAALGLGGILPGAMVGAAAGLLRGAGGSYEGVEQIFNSCKASGVGKSTMDGGTLDSIAKQLYDAVRVWTGTDEDAIESALSRIATIPDLCSVIKRYSENYPGYTLLGDLDGDIDTNSEWNQYVYLPLLRAKRKSEELAAKAAQAKKSTTGGGGAASISEKNWMILYSQLQKMGQNVGLTTNNDGLYWGKAPATWGIWRNSTKGGEFPIKKGNPPTNHYKFLDGVYQGQSLNDMYVIEKGKPGVPIKFKDLIGAKTVSSKSAVKPKVGASAKKPVAKKPSSPSMPDIDFSSGLK